MYRGGGPIFFDRSDWGAWCAAFFGRLARNTRQTPANCTKPRIKARSAAGQRPTAPWAGAFSPSWVFASLGQGCGIKWYERRFERPPAVGCCPLLCLGGKARSGKAGSDDPGDHPKGRTHNPQGLGREAGGLARLVWIGPRPPREGGLGAVKLEIWH